jgi:hypothetical protein
MDGETTAFTGYIRDIVEKIKTKSNLSSWIELKPDQEANGSFILEHLFHKLEHNVGCSLL